MSTTPNPAGATPGPAAKLVCNAPFPMSRRGGIWWTCYIRDHIDRRCVFTAYGRTEAECSANARAVVEAAEMRQRAERYEWFTAHFVGTKWADAPAFLSKHKPEDEKYIRVEDLVSAIDALLLTAPAGRQAGGVT